MTDRANDPSRRPLRIALAGNPNCGKTTLFNALTGSRLRTANWTGVTVDMAVARSRTGDAEIVDLPGIYSLDGRTDEGAAARRVLTDPAKAGIDGVINIIDATALSRSLILTLTMIGMGLPVTLAVNMTDVLEASGAKVDTAKLSAILGIPAVSVCARRRKGLAELMRRVKDQAEASARRDAPRQAGSAVAVRRTNDKSARRDAPRQAKTVSPLRRVNASELRRMTDAQLARLAEAIADECLSGGKVRTDLSDRIDAFVCHPVLGILILCAVMTAVFALTFVLGDLLRIVPDRLIASLAEVLRRIAVDLSAPAWTVSLVCDGIVPGVGAVISFLPELFVMFLCLAVLEDSGYMPRAAWIAHPLMKRLGLSGRAVLPMILGFGCTVPAVLSARIVDGKTPRKRLIGSLPFIPCGARLPVCVMLADMFFGRYRFFAVAGMYLLAVASAVMTAKISGTSDGRIAGCITSGNTCKSCGGCVTYEPFIMEMPDYRYPGLQSVLRISLGRCGEFLRRAGSVIVIASAAVWALVNLSPHGLCASADSIGASIGRLIEPVMRPVGLGQWQIILALICAVGAKELAVTTLTVIFGTSSAAALRLGLCGIGFAAPNALAFIAFVMLYVPCLSTLAVIRSEAGTRTMLGCVLRCTAVAYAAAWTVYHVCVMM